MLDLDAREFAEINEYTKFVERAAANYEIQPLLFDAIEKNGVQVGWTFEFEVKATRAGATSPHYEPPAQAGDVRCINFYQVHKHDFRPQKDMQLLRLLLAAIAGEEHSPEFKANKPLQQLEKLKNLGKLDCIELERTCKIGGEKPEGGNYVNTHDTFRKLS